LGDLGAETSVSKKKKRAAEGGQMPHRRRSVGRRGGAAWAAAEDSIKASGFGLRVAESLRRLGWPDDAVVFALATLPVIELRGAIPVGYWMRLHPVRLTVLSVLGFVTSYPLPSLSLLVNAAPVLDH